MTLPLPFRSDLPSVASQSTEICLSLAPPLLSHHPQADRTSPRFSQSSMSSGLRPSPRLYSSTPMSSLSGRSPTFSACPTRSSSFISAPSPFPFPLSHSPVIFPPSSLTHALSISPPLAFVPSLTRFYPYLSHFSFSAAPDTGWPDCFNSGVMVLEPSDSTFEGLRAMLASGRGVAGYGSFDGGDQGRVRAAHCHPL